MRKNIIDFVVIGAGKSGTTSLHHYLASHPHITMPSPIKETHFFSDPEKFQNQEYYQSLFLHEESQSQLRGEADPHYMLSKDAAYRIHSQNKNTKIIAILRNPTERALSQYKRAVELHAENEFDLLKAIQKEDLSSQSYFESSNNPNYIRGGFYFEQLKPYYDIFPRNQILILFFEDLKKKPENLVNKVYDFLSLAKHKIPKQIASDNRTQYPRFKSLHYFINGDSYLRKKTLAFTPKFLRAYTRKLGIFIKSKNTAQTSTIKNLNPAQNFLKKVYFSHNKKLEHLLKVDLSHWNNI